MASLRWSVISKRCIMARLVWRFVIAMRDARNRKILGTGWRIGWWVDLEYRMGTVK